MVGGLAGGKAKSRGGYGPPGTFENQNVFLNIFYEKQINMRNIFWNVYDPNLLLQ